MADQITRLVVSLIDKTYKPAEGIRANLRKMKADAKALRDAAKDMYRNPAGSRYQPSKAELRAGARGGKKQFSPFSRMELAENLATTGQGMVQLGQQARAALTSAIEPGLEFEDAMANLSARSGVLSREVGGTYDKLASKARAIGKQGKFSGAEAAQGMTLLAQAGFTADQQLGAIDAVLDTATAGVLSMDRAAEIGTDTLYQFGLGADKMRYAMNVLAQGADASSTDIGQMAEALSYVGPIAGTANVSLQQTSAVLASLANKGIKGSMAGTAMRQAILKLGSPETKRAREELERLGIKYKDLNKLLDRPAAQGGADFIGVIDLLRERYAKLGIEGNEVIGSLNRIVKVEASSAMAALIADSGTGALDGFLKQMDVDAQEGVGKIAKVSKEIGGTTSSSIKNLKNNLKDLAITITDELRPVMGPVIEDMKGMVHEFAEWAKVPGNQDTIRTIAKGLAAMAVLAPILSTVMLTLSGIHATMAIGKIAWIGMSGSATTVAKAVGAADTALIGLAKTMPITSGLLRGGLIGVAAAAGYAFGSWLNDTFQLDTALQGVLGTVTGLNATLASMGATTNKRSAPVALGDLTAPEREAQARQIKIRDDAQAELEDLDTWKSALMLNPMMRQKLQSDAQQRMQSAQGELDRINTAAGARVAGLAANGQATAQKVPDAAAFADMFAARMAKAQADMQLKILIETNAGITASIVPTGSKKDRRIKPKVTNGATL